MQGEGEELQRREEGVGCPDALPASLMKCLLHSEEAYGSLCPNVFILANRDI